MTKEQQHTFIYAEENRYRRSGDGLKPKSIYSNQLHVRKRKEGTWEISVFWKRQRVTLDGIQQHRTKSLNPSMKRRTITAVWILRILSCVNC
jgi:hypothetical protein